MIKKQKNKKRITIILVVLFFGLLLFLSNIFAYTTAYFSSNYSGSDANAVIYSSNAYGNWGMMTSYTRLSSNNATNTSIYRIYVHDYTTNNPYYVYYPSGTYVNMWVNGTHVKQHKFNNDIRIYGSGYYQWFYVDVTLKNGVANEIKLQNTDGGGIQTRYFTPPASIYTITYDANGGINAPPTQTFKFNSNEKISSEVPIRDGYTFKGWISNPNDMKFFPSDPIPFDWGSFTLRAEWEMDTYNISYQLNGGYMSNRITNYTVETSTFELPVPSKNGYIFEGWTGSNGTTPQKKVVIEKGSTGNKSYIANWSADIYTVTYDANGGKGGPTETKFHYNANDKISTEIPTREGYVFMGWKTSDEYNFYPGAVIPKNYKSFTLYAQWNISIYSVIFQNWNGSILSTQNVKYGENANPPTVPTRVGYTFTGWDKAYTNITSDCVITATFSVNQYTISFNTNGGSSVANQIVNYGGKVNKPKNPVKDGLIFEDWYIDKTLKTKYDFNKPVSSNLVLYAKWISYPQITTKYDRYFLVQEKFDIEDIKNKIKAVDEYNNDISNRIALTGFENVKVGVVGDYPIIASLITDLGYEAKALITIHISDDMPMQQIRSIHQNALNSLSLNSKWWNNINVLKMILEKDNVIDTITIKNE